MKSKAWPAILALAGLLVFSGGASARGLSVELWTDRGNDAVYQPGDPILIKARTSEDAYLLVYEIDAEGGVNVLFPSPGRSDAVEARQTLRLPGDDQNDLVVDQTTGQGYIVAIASDRPFEDLPWYLRPHDPQAEEVGYVGQPEDEEEGVTQEGLIVGDPFVAMERIRRRVLHDAEDEDGFATAYTSYYVHERVRYPRYICNDCHRPGRYEFWSGFDPYYTTCSVFDFRVNWSWGWGPRYWHGSVPYFVYVYRDDCPPAYRRYSGTGIWYSSWDGWNRWRDLWGAQGLRRFKSTPPQNYVPPDRYFTDDRTRRQLPPGYLAGGVEKRGGVRQRVGFGVGDEYPGDERGANRGGGGRERRDEEIGGTRREARPDGRREPAGREPAAPRGWNNDRGQRTSAPPPVRPGSPREERGDSPRGTRAPARPWVERKPMSRPTEEYRQPAPRREERAPETRAPERAPEPRREERAPSPPPQYKAPDPPRPEPPRQEPRPEPPKNRDEHRGNDNGGRQRR